MANIKRINTLLHKLGSGTWEERTSNVEKLVKLDEPEEIACIINYLEKHSASEEPYYPIIDDTYDVLVGIGKRAVEQLISSMKKENWAFRVRVLLILGKIGDTRAVETLLSSLGDRMWNVREAARRALTMITNQHFHEDAQDEWKKWWEENKSQFIKEK